MIITYKLYKILLDFQTVSRLDPKFIALHCQEVGGKNYEQSMRHVEDFVRYVNMKKNQMLFSLNKNWELVTIYIVLVMMYSIARSVKKMLDNFPLTGDYRRFLIFNGWRFINLGFYTCLWLKWQEKLQANHFSLVFEKK